MEENRNNVHVSLDLSTNTGKTILIAIASALGGATEGKVQAQKAAPAPKSASTAVADVAETATQTSGETTPEPKAAAKPAAKAAAKPAAKAAPAPKAAAPKPAAKPAEVDFADLEPEAQLVAIQTHVTKHTKKGKSMDIKALLSNFGADRASNLEPEHYADFNEVLHRYSAGESVEDIFPALD